MTANKYKGFIKAYTDIKDGLSTGVHTANPPPSPPSVYPFYPSSEGIPVVEATLSLTLLFCPPPTFPSFPLLADETKVASLMPDHKHLNRYNNIVAYDSSRVKVEVPNAVSAHLALVVSLRPLPFARSPSVLS